MQAHLLTEAELSSIVVQMAEDHGWMVKPPDKARSSATAGNRRAHRNGSASGFPDLVLARDGELLFIELKTEEGTQTIMQMAWGEAIGPLYHVIRPRDLPRGRVEELLR